MIGNLEPEETVLEPTWRQELERLITELGWEGTPEVVVGGTSVYEIDGAGTKWAPLKGTRKYNSDAFIVIRQPKPVISSKND